MKFEIAVIIVTYNNKKTIQKCLESVFSTLPFEARSNERSRGTSLRTYIVDNASEDKTAEIVNRNPESGNRRIKLTINQKNIGFAKAVNQGIKSAQKEFDPDFFLLLNPDACLAPDCIQKLINDGVSSPRPPLSSPRRRGSISQNNYNKRIDSRLRGNDNGIDHALLSPLILNPKTKKPWFTGGKIAWLRMRTKHVVRNYEPACRQNQELENPDYGLRITDYLTGCCLLIPKQIIKQIGLLDEKFFLYYEDADFSLRAKKAGFDLKIIPDAICYHSESTSFNQLEKLSSNTTIKQFNNKVSPIHHSSFIIHHSKNYHLVKSGLLFFHKRYPSWAKPYFWLIYYLRLFYHKHISKKQNITQAFEDFRKNNS